MANKYVSMSIIKRDLEEMIKSLETYDSKTYKVETIISHLKEALLQLDND